MNKYLKSVLVAISGALLLLLVYFAILTLVSGWEFSKEQFFQFWYYIVSLAFGFGLQLGLFTYLKNVIHNRSGTGKVVAVSGMTSTLAMISCCAHYLVNLAPVLGATGLISFVSAYQVELFWIGLLSNLFGIIYISNRILKFKSLPL